MIRHLVVVVVGVSAAGAPAQTACVDDCLLVLLYAAVAIAIDLTKVIVVVVFVFVAVTGVTCNNTFTVMSIL